MSEFGDWPPELLARVIKAMTPESVCRTCGEPRRRIVSQLNEVRHRLSSEIMRGRIATGLTQKEVAAWFPSVTGGLTGCVWNWENAKTVPTTSQWSILRERLGLSREFDELIEAESRWNDAEYVPLGDPARDNAQPKASADYPLQQRNQNAQGMVYGRAVKISNDAGFSDCGHDNYRNGVVLDPFGTGSTSEVAETLGRDSIEIQP